MQNHHHSDTHRRGETVEVFTDPLTKLEPEGTARLVRFIRATPDGLEEWSVRFRGEQARYFRII